MKFCDFFILERLIFMDSIYLWVEVMSTNSLGYAQFWISRHVTVRLPIGLFNVITFISALLPALRIANIMLSRFIFLVRAWGKTHTLTGFGWRFSFERLANVCV